MRRWMVVCVLLGLCACGDRDSTVGSGSDPNAPDAAAGVDAGCAIPCGSGCCASGQACEGDVCRCKPACDGKRCGPDGCGGQCGTCSAGTTCDLAKFECVEHCVPESDGAFCRREQKECGSFTGKDNCAAPRTANCGSCPVDRSCDLDTNTCFEPCPPESDAEFCGRLGRACGSATGLDSCGKERTVADCGSCTWPEHCEDGTCAPCVPETDAAFCARLALECGSADEPDNCGQPRRVDCGTCILPKYCDLNVCQSPQPPPNENCASALALTFDASGVARARGSTELAVNDGTSPRCWGGGVDVVYSFTTTATKNVSVLLDPGHAGTSVLYVRTACTDLNSEVGCSNLKEVPNGLLLEELPAGTYYLWVDNDARMSGRFELTVTAEDPPAAPADDTCPAARPLTFSGTSATASGTTVSASDDATGTCATSPGPEVFFSFELTADTLVSAKVVRDPGTPWFEPMVYLRSGCDRLASEPSCARSFRGMAQTAAVLLPAGVHHVVVDGLRGTVGRFTLTLVAEPPMANDTCASPTALAFDPRLGIATATGNTALATDDGAPTCATTSGKDVVYAITVPAGAQKNVSVLVEPDGGSQLRPVLSVRADCALRSTELSCAAKSTVAPAALKLSRLDPGTYFAWVDGAAASQNGPFTLRATMADVLPPPPEDLCVGAEPIALPAANPRVTINGDTTNAMNDATGTCGAMDGPEVFYSFTLAEERHVYASVSRRNDDPAFFPAIYIRANCSTGTPDQRACAVGAGGVATINQKLPAGTYYLVVDGTSMSMGEFSLDFRAVPPITNDSCAQPQPITLDAAGEARIVSDNTSATHETWGYCGGNPGPDMVFKLSLAAPKDVEVQLTPLLGGNLLGVVSMRSNCSDVNSQLTRACATATAVGASGGFKSRRVPAGDYFIWVDGHANSSGPYQLFVRASDPPPPPANDTCRIAEPIVLDTTNSATVFGDTSYAFDDADGSCRTPSGPDLVYQLTTTTMKDVTLTVEPDGGSPLRPAVYLRSSCEDAATERGCAELNVGTTAQLLAPRLPAGTHYVHVDTTVPGYEGAFTLHVAAPDTPAPPANDVCAGVTSLAFDPVTQKATVTGNTTLAFDDYAGTCETTYSKHTGYDVVYAFALTDEHGVEVKLTRDAADSTFYPVAYLRSACDSVAAGDELGCRPSSAGVATFIAPDLLPGTYYVVVDGANKSKGGYTLEVTLLPPLRNDTCRAPEPVAFDVSGKATINGDTSTARDNSASVACPGTSGPDLAYLVDTRGLGRANLSARLTYLVAGVQPALHLKSDCAGTTSASEAACKRQEWDAPMTLLAADLAEGLYYLWVDSANGGRGSFMLDLELQVLPAPGANDTCRAALPLGFDASGIAQATGATTAAANDYGGSCGPGSGADVVYRFDVAVDSGFRAVVTRAATSGTFEPMVYVRRSCEGIAYSNEAGCALHASGVATLDIPWLAPGTYHVIVDGKNATSGDFTLDATLLPAVRGDGCSDPVELPLDDHPLQITGDTTRAKGNATSSCGSGASSSQDLVYAFTLSEDRTVDVQVTPSATLRPAVYLRSACDDKPAEFPTACNRATTAGAVARFNIPRLPAGTWYLWVDSEANAPGTFTLDIAATAPPAAPGNDQCGGVETLTVDPVTNVATVTGTTKWALNDGTASCEAATGPDVVYAFTTTAAQKVTATVTKDASATGLEPVVSIRGACDLAQTETEVTCAKSTSGVAKAVFNNLPAGTWYVWVDGGKGIGGAYTLELKLEAPGTTAANESCRFAAPLSFTNGVASVTGTLVGAQHDAKGGCTHSTAPDVVYSFTLTAPQKVTAKVTPQTGYRPAVFLRASCGGADLACGTAIAAGNTATVVSKNLAPGTYFVWVDVAGTSITQGTFTLNVTLEAPSLPPAHDTCAGPVGLASGATLTESAIPDATNAFGAGLSAPCRGNARNLEPTGRDLVYTYTPSVDGNFTVTLTPGLYADFVLWVSTGTCGDGASCLAASDAGADGVVEVVTVRGVAGTTYYIYADSRGTPIGSFTISIQ